MEKVENRKPCPGGHIYECCDPSEVGGPGNGGGGNDPGSGEHDVGMSHF